MERAHALGYKALALTDECSLAGVVRAHQAAKECGLPLILGTEIARRRSLKLVLLATDRRSYGAISSLITTGRRRSKKGGYSLARERTSRRLHGSGALVLWIPGEDFAPAAWLASAFAATAWIAAELHCGPNDRREVDGSAERSLETAGCRWSPPATCTCTCARAAACRTCSPRSASASRWRNAGRRCFPNAERHLRLRVRLAQLYPPELLAETVAIAERCRFSLDELRYEYPDELVPPGETPASWLRKLTEDGLRRRFPAGVPAKVAALVEHELQLIAELALRAVLPHGARRGALRARRRASCARAAARRRTRWSATRCGITEVDPDAHEHAVRALRLAASATSRRTSTSTSSTSGARR